MKSQYSRDRTPYARTMDVAASSSFPPANCVDQQELAMVSFKAFRALEKVYDSRARQTGVSKNVGSNLVIHPFVH